MSFTKGPWQFSKKNWRNEKDVLNRYVTGDHHEDEEGGYCTSVAIVVGNATSGTIADDNARLISAAPDLLAALEKLSYFCCRPGDDDKYDDGYDDAKRMTRAAIAKARGIDAASDNR